MLDHYKGERVAVTRDLNGVGSSVSIASPVRLTAGSPRILAFAGPIGAGKSTLSKALASRLGWKRVGFGSAVRDEAARRGLSTARPSLQELGVQLIVEPGWEPFCRLVLAQAGWQQGEPLLLSGVRHEEALRALRIVVAPTKVELVYLWAPLHVRKERIMAISPEDAENLEVAERHSTELQVQRNLPRLADMRLEGTRPITELVEEVVDWIDSGEPRSIRQSLVPEDALAAVRLWLEADQYEHGEWGVSEVRDPTAPPRTFTVSKVKPNVFSSCQVAYALLATGPAMTPTLARFVQWMERLRSPGNGAWTSAGGSAMPIGGELERSWSEVPNVRHTAKGLDLLLLRGEFRAEDVMTLRWILETQLPDGAFPHFAGGAADLWSTAYVLNLALRILSGDNLRRTWPRGFTLDDWGQKLGTVRDRATSWLCMQRGPDGMWQLDGRDSRSVTEAVAVEIGAHLAMSRPDVCRTVGRTLLQSLMISRSAKAAWALLLMWEALDADTQREILRNLPDILQREWENDDNLEVSCLARLLWLARDPLVLGYYVQTSGRHESALADWRGWATTDYERWSVRQALARLSNGERSLTAAPVDKASAWLSVLGVVDEFRRGVEMNRGWELLWDERLASPRDEDSIQIAFSTMVEPVCHELGIDIHRESETGRGPVDFDFSNGARATVQLEFKRADSAKLIEGVRAQIIEYADARRVDSVLYVCVAFDQAGQGRFQAVGQEVERVQSEYPDLFIRAEFVDASQRPGASKLKAPSRRRRSNL